MAISPEAQAKVAMWRQKALDGTLTREEMKEAIEILREDRVTCATAATKSKKKKAPVNSDALLDELGGL